MAEHLTQEVTRIKKVRKQRAFSFFTYFFVTTKKGHSPTGILCPLPCCVIACNNFSKKYSF